MMDCASCLQAEPGEPRALARGLTPPARHVGPASPSWPPARLVAATAGPCSNGLAREVVVGVWGILWWAACRLGGINYHRRNQSPRGKLGEGSLKGMGLIEFAPEDILAPVSLDPARLVDRRYWPKHNATVFGVSPRRDRGCAPTRLQF